MRVLIVSQTYWPDASATGQLMTDLAEYLVTKGAEVRVIASRLPYLDRRAPLHAAAEVRAGVGVRRVNALRIPKGAALLRGAEFLNFMVLAARAVLDEARDARRRPDVILVTTPPPLIGLLAAWVQSRTGIPVVYEAMDIYPDVLRASGLLGPIGWLSPVFERLYRVSYRKTAATIVLGNDVAALLRGPPERCEASRLHVVHPWSTVEGDGPAPMPMKPRADFAVMYSGNLGIAHDWKTPLDGWARWRSESAFRRSALLEFVGGGRRFDDARRYSLAHAIPDVSFREYVRREQLRESLTSAHVHVVSLRPEFADLMFPSKFASACEIGRPLLVIAPSGAEVARLAREYACGTVVEPGDAAGAADAYEEFALRPERRARVGDAARLAYGSAFARDLGCEVHRRVLTKAAVSLTTGSPPHPLPAAQPPH